MTIWNRMQADLAAACAAGFGEPATYDAGAGPVAVEVIFRDRLLDAELDIRSQGADIGVPVVDAVAKAWVRFDGLPAAPKRRHRLTIRGRDYVVEAVDPDGTAAAWLWLRVA
jgi:hypothetical protein